ncbi:hypothetical protein AAC387_Pa07g2284 [Persea americana]
MDKSWIDLPNRMSREYMDGINHFMEFTNGFDNEFIIGVYKKSVNLSIRPDPIRSADFDLIRRPTDW